MIISAGAPIILVAIWGAAPTSLIVTAQAINGILLPFIGAIVWKISSDKKYLGEYANKTWFNVVYGIIFLLALLLAARTFINIF